MRKIREFSLFCLGIVLIVCGISIDAVDAATYYVSSSDTNASDSNPGTQALPFKTISKANSLNLAAGDSVLFKCGDTWRAEQLLITKSGASGSPITFSSYPLGCTNKPIFSGAQPITNWSDQGGNIYKADLTAWGSGLGVNQLFQNGQRLTMGRWPNLTAVNGGYSTIDEHPSEHQITDYELPAVDWTGAVAHLRSDRWRLQNRAVTADSGQTLTLQNYNYSYGACEGGCAGWGYFLNNHYNTLDQHGEWYYNPTTRQVYLYFTSGSPTNIEGSVVLTDKNAANTSSPLDHGGIMIGGAIAYVVIDNIELKNWFHHGISMPLIMPGGTQPQYVTVRNMAITNVEAAGIQLWTNILTNNQEDWRGGQYMTVNNNTIDGANHFGISSYSSNSTFQDNVIKNIGLVKNFGKNGIGCGISDYGCAQNGDGLRIYSHQIPNSGANNTVQYNRIERVGYSGIHIFGPQNNIYFNVVNECLYTKSDGGCIRVASTNPTITNPPEVGLQNTSTYNVNVIHNIILNSVGNADGVKASLQQPFGVGIYIGEYGRDVVVSHNTISNTSFVGTYYVYSTGTYRLNTTYRHAYGTMAGSGLQLIGSITSVASDQNIFYSLDPNSWNMYVESPNYLLSSDDNYFFYPYYPYNGIGYGVPPTVNTLEHWQAYSGKDLNSKKHWFTLIPGDPNNAEIFYNDTKAAKAFSLGTTLYQDLDQNPVSGSITLQPFTSKILINTGQTIPSNSYLLWTR
ncbi:MAG: right-handed parallel beta-helix repeat-containing protein [Candidatus Vecturithrix sp.]|jgi:hypothetical protein|nr:right-handed parallel beta-helix repeat-containing protein [Candidatus Vecturithrix sp.]